MSFSLPTTNARPAGGLVQAWPSLLSLLAGADFGPVDQAKAISVDTVVLLLKAASLWRGGNDRIALSVPMLSSIKPLSLDVRLNKRVCRSCAGNFLAGRDMSSKPNI